MVYFGYPLLSGFVWSYLLLWSAGQEDVKSRRCKQELFSIGTGRTIILTLFGRGVDIAS